MEKNTILILVLFVTGFSFRALSEDAATFCDETVECTPVMKNISKKYSAANTDFVNLKESAYSGACYHINQQYNSKTKHHGAFAFEKSGSQILSGGVFAFFYDEDPYKNLSGHQLNEWLKTNSSAFQAIAVSKAEAKLEYLNPNSNISYWFRSSADKNSLFVIGKDVGDSAINLVFCQMSVR